MNWQLSRRTFLSALGLAAVGATLPILPRLRDRVSNANKAPPSHGPIPLFPRLFSALPAVGQQSAMVVFSPLHENASRHVPVPEFPLAHSLTFLPGFSGPLLLELGGVGAAWLDPATSALESRSFLPPSRVFGGHVRASADGKLLYFTEFENGDPARGWLVARDARDFREVGRARTKGVLPHGIMFAGPDQIVVQHIGAPGGEQQFSGRAGFSAHRLSDLSFLRNLPIAADPRSLSGQATDEKPAFLRRCAYLMDLRQYLLPKAPLTLVEDPEGMRVTLWEMPTRKLLRTHSTAPYHPAHSAITKDYSSFIVATREGPTFRLGLADGLFEKLPALVPCTSHATIG